MWRVSFNGGDRWFAGNISRIDFSGSLEEWEKWLRAFAAGAEIDRFILFGSSREIHLVARNVAMDLGVGVLSLEEGYIRPGFVTAEFVGNNADSPLAGMLPPTDFVGTTEPQAGEAYSSFAAMCRSAGIYYVARTLLSGLGTRPLFHRRFNAFVEPFLWGRNFWRSLTRKGRDFYTIEKLLEHFDKKFFLVPLQVPSDAQMRVASRGWDSQRLITEVMASFAKKGPGDHRLVFKVHPLERGHSDVRRSVQQMAKAFGVSDRVDVIENGSLGLLTRHSAGMITINSTSGLSAIFHGVPLMVIGDAIYANDRLATVARGTPNFDRFWTEGFVGDAQLRRRYLRWLRKQALVPGDFYGAEGIEVACKGIVKKAGLLPVAFKELDARKQAC